MAELKVLQLKASKECFEEIVSGRRQYEFREIKPFWTSRLEGKHYDELHFRNGYSPTAPFARLKCEGVSVGEREGQPVYAIKLGRVLETQFYGEK
jgi:hypothetical protein